MTQQAKPDLPVGDDLQAAFGVAGRSGQRCGKCVAYHRGGPQLLCRRYRDAQHEAGRYHPSLQPNTSPVIVLNQPSANWASTGHQPERSATPAFCAIAAAFCGGITFATSARWSAKSVLSVFVAASTAFTLPPFDSDTHSR